MNQIQVYQLLQENGFKKEAAQQMVDALKENEDLATKLDLKDMELRMMSDISKRFEVVSDKFETVSEKFETILKAMNVQTWKFIGGISLLAFLIKMTDLLTK